MELGFCSFPWFSGTDGTEPKWSCLTTKVPWFQNKDQTHHLQFRKIEHMQQQGEQTQPHDRRNGGTAKMLDVYPENKCFGQSCFTEVKNVYWKDALLGCGSKGVFSQLFDD